MSYKIRVFIVEDEPMILDELKSLPLWQELGYEISGTALSADDALRQIRNLRPDVLMTDIRLGDQNGLDLIESVQTFTDQMYSVILSGYGEFEYARRAVHLQVTEYLTKPLDPDKMRQVFSGIAARIRTQSVSAPLPQPDFEAVPTLSRKAMHYVQKHIGENLSLQSIADSLFISASYLSRVFKKETGQNLITYINTQRVKKACEYMRRMDLGIYEVMMKVGFSDYSYFCVIFKKITGKTPLTYRVELLKTRERKTP